MKFVPLVWAALMRRKARTMLTVLSVLIAFLLFGLLDSVRSTFDNAGQSSPGRSRILVTPKSGMGTKPLPFSLLTQITDIPGVMGIDYASYVVGTYQDPKNSIAVEAHPESFFQLYPEVSVKSEELSALRGTRTGVLAGEMLIHKFGWKVGDKIALLTAQPRKDGSTVWTFDLVGSFHFTDENMKINEVLLYGNYQYVEEARAQEAGTVTYYSVKVASPSDVDRVAALIDHATANSNHETKSQSENAWANAQLQQYGDLGFVVTSIMGAVFFTLLLLTGHTMLRAVHERIPEIAVLKTLGFRGKKIVALILFESMSIVLIGALIGLVTAMLAVTWVRSLEILPIPISSVGTDVWLRGISAAVVLGIVVGILPAVRGLRLRIVDALSGR